MTNLRNSIQLCKYYMLLNLCMFGILHYIQLVNCKHLLYMRHIQKDKLRIYQDLVYIHHSIRCIHSNHKLSMMLGSKSHFSEQEGIHNHCKYQQSCIQCIQVCIDDMLKHLDRIQSCMRCMRLKKCKLSKNQGILVHKYLLYMSCRLEDK